MMNSISIRTKSLLARCCSLIEERRLPGKVKRMASDLLSVACYWQNTMRKPDEAYPIRSKVSFWCGFHGRTGSVVAIAQIAGILAQRYRVEFVSHPRSYYNALLDKKVQIVTRPSEDAQLYIVDVPLPVDDKKRLRDKGKQVVVSCHGFPTASHGLTEGHVKESFQVASKVHFVNSTQQDAFQLRTDKYFIIPNMTDKIEKKVCTNNVGIIGNAANPIKNIRKAIEICLDSSAEMIHVWGTEAPMRGYPKRVVIHPWARDKNQIYNSFDVLVTLSLKETFGMTVAEALSAGLPCLISDIPAFRQYGDCNGVQMIDPDDTASLVKGVNELLRKKDNLKAENMAFWSTRFSANVIYKKWLHLLTDLMRFL